MEKNNDLLNRALVIQNKDLLGLKKNEKEYAFTFIYPPSMVLSKLESEPFGGRIESANMYIHIPYCTGKCTYCYFGCYSLAEAPLGKNQYVERLCKEMEMINKKYGSVKIQSLHFGGGTPTTLTEQNFDKIFTSIRNNFDLKSNIEITCESSPETISEKKLICLLKNGVNRLNIGIQTLNNQLLKNINRRHDANQAIESIIMAKKEGFKNINVDLIYGLEEQTMKDWEETLHTILDLNLESISTYRLRIHPNSKIRDQASLFDEKLAIEMYVAMLNIMGQYQYYQCSSHKFAIKKELAQKQIVNKRGIKNNTLIPVGMAAYGYIGKTLFWNERRMENYIHKIDNNLLPYSIGYKLDKIEEMAKSCVLGIHNVEGINLIEFTEKFGQDINSIYGNLIYDLKKNELIEITKSHLKLSKLGMVFADEIATKFYSDTIKKMLSKKKKKYGIFFDDIIDGREIKNEVM